jgi:hypothetical protein
MRAERIVMAAAIAMVEVVATGTEAAIMAAVEAVEIGMLTVTMLP